MTRDSDILHDAGEPRLQGGRLYSMLDLMGPTITCDQCGRWQRLDALLTSDARKDAERKGWQQRDGKDICRICAASLPESPEA